jgi:hypothetical protein
MCITRSDRDCGTEVGWGDGLTIISVTPAPDRSGQRNRAGIHSAGS